MEAGNGTAGPDEPAGAQAPVPSLGQFCLVFARIAVTSFGGGVTAWMMREIVQVRRWMTDEEFLADLAMSQALPGVNVVNLPIWIGYRFHGPVGALTCALAVIVPGAMMLAAVATAFAGLAGFRATGLAFEGAAAAAIGLTLATGLLAARSTARNLFSTLVMGVTFTAVGVLKLPMVPVMLVLAPISIAVAAWERRRA